MTASSSESTQPSSDTINVLPILSEAKAPVSLTLTIDKSVSKVASHVITIILGCAVALGLCLAAIMWMVFEARDMRDTHAREIADLKQAHREELAQLTDAFNKQERQARLVEYYIHETDGKMIAAGFLKPSQNFDNFKDQQEKRK